MRLLKKFSVGLLLLLAFVSVVIGQDDCPDLVDAALERTAEECSALTRNQACYGNISVNVTARADVTDVLEEVGDTADLADIQGLTLSPMDVDNESWGMVVMSVQANLPDTLPGQNVTMLLFGDVEVTDAATDAQEDDFTPMQAFYFRSGIGDSACAEAPNSGILIQTPEGAGTIELTMNDVNITLGSTAYIQAEPEGEMIFNVLEGEGMVEADEVEREVPAGMRVSVSLDEDLRAVDEPSEPEPYDAAEFEALPLELLPREVEVAGGENEGGSSGVGSNIAIEPGTWQLTISTQEGCDITPDITARIAPTTFEIASTEIEHVLDSADPLGGFTALYFSAARAQGIDFVISNLETNVYVFELNEEGVSLTTTYTITAPTTIEFVSEITTYCTLVETGTLERIGD